MHRLSEITHLKKGLPDVIQVSSNNKFCRFGQNVQTSCSVIGFYINIKRFNVVDSPLLLSYKFLFYSEILLPAMRCNESVPFYL